MTNTHKQIGLNERIKAVGDLEKAKALLTLQPMASMKTLRRRARLMARLEKKQGKPAAK